MLNIKFKKGTNNIFHTIFTYCFYLSATRQIENQRSASYYYCQTNYQNINWEIKNNNPLRTWSKWLSEVSERLSTTSKVARSVVTWNSVPILMTAEKTSKSHILNNQGSKKNVVRPPFFYLFDLKEQPTEFQ